MSHRRLSSRSSGHFGLCAIAALGFAAFATLTAACGGKTLGGSGTGTQDAGTPDAQNEQSECVEITITAAQQTCERDSDCTLALTGLVCAGDCPCGFVPVNATSATAIAGREQGIGLAECGCGASEELPSCIHGQCAFADVDAGGGFEDGGGGDCPGCNDGGGGDGGGGDSDGGGGGFDSGFDSNFDDSMCVNIDLSTYDQSCNTASDCTTILTGQVCNGACECLGSPINVSGEAQYEQATQSIMFGECGCPSEGALACVQGTCTICGFGATQPGCPDAGQ
jgi:hypothetical protein